MWRGTTSKCKLAGVFVTRMIDPVCCVEPNGTPVLVIAELSDGGATIYRNGNKVDIDQQSFARLHRGSAFDESPAPVQEARAKRPHEPIEGHLKYWLRDHPRSLWNIAGELGVDDEVADAVWRDLFETEPPCLERPKRVPPTEASRRHVEEQRQRQRQHRARLSQRAQKQQELEAAIDAQLQLAWGRKTKPEPTVIVEPAPPPQPPRPPVVVVDQLQQRRMELARIYRLLGWKAA